MNELQKLSYLREEMDERGVSACIIPSSDPHLSEYPASHWKLREYISGFTGSNGTLVITHSEAFLWTDSRYYLQAEKELNPQLFRLQREGELDTPSILDWLKINLKQGDTIGVDGTTFSASELKQWKDELLHYGMKIESDFQTELSHHLPPLPSEKAFLLDVKFCGESSLNKINRIIEKLDSDYLLLTALDEVAWTFNLRGSDIAFNPMAIAYGCIGKECSHLFIDKEKLTPSLESHFENNKIILHPYNQITGFIEDLNRKKKSISVDATRTNFKLYNLIEDSLRKNVISPVSLFKSIKNETEIQNLEETMKADGVALCRALSYIEEQVVNDKNLSEYEIGEVLHKFRRMSPQFFCDSFAPIVGYGENGAVVHYKAEKESAAKVSSNNLLLIDSGGNYYGGTTDITRTFCFGEPTEQQKRDYTLVLKGHIALARQSFPVGTCGEQLDILARQFLWNEKLNYGHGTGHGIGHFLCVHEGPQTIRPKGNGIPLQSGMLVSDEPGLYRTRQYGIRIENVVCVRSKTESKTSMGKFFEFKTLTLFPYETKLIKKSLLTSDELDWINNYHQHVFDALSPLLKEGKSYEWLKNKTKRVANE